MVMQVSLSKTKLGKDSGMHINCNATKCFILICFGCNNWTVPQLCL